MTPTDNLAVVAMRSTKALYTALPKRRDTDRLGSIRRHCARFGHAERVWLNLAADLDDMAVRGCRWHQRF